MTESNSHNVKKGQKRKSPERETSVPSQDLNQRTDWGARMLKGSDAGQKDQKEEVDAKNTQTHEHVPAGGERRLLDSRIDEEFFELLKRARAIAEKDLLSDMKSDGSAAQAAAGMRATQPGPVPAEVVQYALSRYCHKFASCEGSILAPGTGPSELFEFSVPAGVDQRIVRHMLESALIATNYLYAYHAHAMDMPLIYPDDKDVELIVLYERCFCTVFDRITEEVKRLRTEEAEKRLDFLQTVRVDFQNAAWTFAAFSSGPYFGTPLGVLLDFIDQSNISNPDVDWLKESLLAKEASASEAKRVRIKKYD